MNRIVKVIVYSALTGLVACGVKTESTRPVYKVITESVFAPGQLEAEQTYDLTARTEGYIESTVLEEGLDVKEGQVLAVINNNQSQIDLDQASALYEIAADNAAPSAPELQRLRNNETVAKERYILDSIQWHRYDRLYSNGSIAKTEWDEAAYNMKNSRLAWQNARESYAQASSSAHERVVNDRAQKRVSGEVSTFRQVKGLVSGKVLARFKKAGDFVKKGDVIARIGNVERIYAKVYVDEESIDRISEGQKVVIKSNAEKTTLYDGVVDYVYPEFDQQQQAFACKIKFLKPPKLRVVGTQVESNIVVGEERKALVIPRRFLDEGGRVQIKGKNEKVVVRTGFIGEEWVEILDGIDSTQFIVIEKVESN
jgi:multidrug efflux pump subunit AcrA (membrane-fusion protein)